MSDQPYEPTPGSLDDKILKALYEFPSGAKCRDILRRVGERSMGGQYEYPTIYNRLRVLAQLDLLIWDSWGDDTYGTGGSTWWRPIYRPDDAPASRSREDVERWLNT